MPKFDHIWIKIRDHAGNLFHSKRGHRFTYKIVSENVITIVRPTFERSVGRSVFEQAYSRGLPMNGPSEINDLQAPSFVWAILHDRRIVAPR